MKLSPKAHRFVTEAVRDLRGTSGRERLLSWLDRSAGQELPIEIALLALGALERLEYWMRQRLESGDIDEDQRSDLMNDIAFIHSIENDLKRETARGAVG
ncbi:MAG: hypothetical protein ACLQJR_11495 [Stellaceae bacterium]